MNHATKSNLQDVTNTTAAGETIANRIDQESLKICIILI
jgi:hypothetical protein